MQGRWGWKGEGLVMPWRAILKFACLVLLAELAATLGSAWYFGSRTLEHWVNGATAVALLVGLLGLSLTGPLSFARGHELESDGRNVARDPRRWTTGPAACCSWLAPRCGFCWRLRRIRA